MDTARIASNSSPRKDKLLLVGHANVGKSVLFNRLSGQYAVVSNYPGTTVELAEGLIEKGDKDIRIIDTPGIQSILPQSEDEVVTRDLLLSWDGIIVQVGDAKNLGRVLALTFQLSLLNKPMILVLNMMDEAKASGITFDIDKLQEALGIPVIPMVAIEGIGVEDLMENIKKASIPKPPFSLNEVLGESFIKITQVFPKYTPALALMVYMGDETLSSWAKKHNLPLPSENRPRPMPIHHLFYFFFRQGQRLADKVTDLKPRRSLPYSHVLDIITLHPLFGIPILLLVLLIGYFFVGVLGAGTLVDFFENFLFGKVLLPPITTLIHATIPWNGLQEALVGNFGLLTMAIPYAFAIIFPVVTTFFIYFSFLEDSGYFPRLSSMVHRLFQVIGLSGKAVLPMILGLGCDTMATITTRILPTRKERILVTLLLALGVPCSAQLAVILAMMGSVSLKGTLIWAGVILLNLFIVGLVASYLVPGRRGAFILELPPLRFPQVKNILAKTRLRLVWYLKEVVPIFIYATFVLFILDKAGILAFIQQKIQPFTVTLLSLPKETANAFLMGFFRRDYGAAGLFYLYQHGQLTPIQVVVSSVVITLFIPCFANFLVIIKERGWKTALAMVLFIVPYAFGVGALLNLLLRRFPIL